MAFLEDPRIRQSWNQISHSAEIATENAAASLWTFQQDYINPCLASLSQYIDQCTSVCLGDREERARRQRERERARAEYSFDFYDDWARDESMANGGGGGMSVSVSSLLGHWSNEDWDRLLVGSSATRYHGEGIVDQPPRRKRPMNYGTRRRTTEDPTVIPSSQPIGFLGRLPWKIGGTLRYKPSAADLQDHPFRQNQGERQALLSHAEEDEYFLGTEQPLHPRTRRNTSGSRATSDSYRSRGDLFPSDVEGDEDAVPLGDEFSVDFDRSDDRSSNRTRSSRGKGPAGSNSGQASRTMSRSTVGSGHSTRSPLQPAGNSMSSTPENMSMVQSMDDLRQEDERLRQEEEREIEAKKRAAVQLAVTRSLREYQVKQGSQSIGSESAAETIVPTPALKASKVKPDVTEDVVYVNQTAAKKPAMVEQKEVRMPMKAQIERAGSLPAKAEAAIVEQEMPVYSDIIVGSPKETSSGFVPARLPHFG
ncbi:hypothetical protein TD95_001286 [Thielaviopsis punctulata]|uniref:Uncharacterized protein n=1 Tax=Thielaviopsis punctulata TaxID=72032 RepID=A0A0F4ZB44_9PEZI|nr:hypothetical protein TD95_001286 [Thielaviopsis punctulata]